MITHHLSAEQFDRIAEGFGGPSAIQTLSEAQVSKRLLLLKFLAEGWPPPHDVRDAALAVLARTQLESPDALTAVLGEPSTAGWLTRLVTRLRAETEGATNVVPVGVELGQLGSIAMAGAYRAGLDADLEVPVRDGGVYLPTLGAFHVLEPDGTAVRLRARSGTIAALVGTEELRMPDRQDTTSPTWRPLRRLHSTIDGHSVSVTLDDLDPFRDVYHAPPARRLDHGSVLQWTERFTQSWHLLVRDAPERATEMTTGLRAIVPLWTSEGVAKSGTPRHVFGAFGASLPGSGLELAVTMVHEFQHSKLSALLDLYPLVEADDSERYFAPWRVDPRPIGGLLQGVYAFLAVADVYAAFRTTTVIPAARHEFTWAREQVRSGLTTLVDSGKLTELGMRFAAGLHRTLDRLLEVPVPADELEAAQRRLAATRAAWATQR